MLSSNYEGKKPQNNKNKTKEQKQPPNKTKHIKKEGS